MLVSISILHKTELALSSFVASPLTNLSINKMTKRGPTDTVIIHQSTSSGQAIKKLYPSNVPYVTIYPPTNRESILGTPQPVNALDKGEIKY
jgi:hypothetical protein